MLKLVIFLIGIATTFGQLDDRTIMKYVQDEGLTTLAGFLTGTGLDAVLGDANAPAMTLFAPTENAWTKVPANLLISLATNSSALKSVLLGHLIDQVVLGLYVRDKDAKTNFNGDPMDFRVYANGEKTVNGAQLVGKDISLANGVVHMIDNVILPTTSNIGEYVAQHDTDFRDLFGLLVVGRLFGALETSGPFTVFAPVDSAFDAIRANLTTLVQDRDALAKILEYHVVPDTYWSVGLTDGMTLQTLHGGNLTISIGPDGVKVDNAKVTTADIATSNGVIHVLDAVLNP